jgi:hypothetical protein
MSHWPQPTVKSMVLCEDVLPGPGGTGNVHLMNVFSAIHPHSPFPFHQPQLCVFLQLTDAQGEVTGSVVARRADGGAIVFASEEHVIRFTDRLQVKWVLFRLRDCPFPSPGLYCMEFCCNQRPIFDQMIRLLEP